MGADAEATTTRTEQGSTSSGRSTGVSQALTGRMLMAAVVSAISSLLYGYDTGIISGALLQIRRDFDTGSAMEQGSPRASCSARCWARSPAASSPSGRAGARRS